MQKKTTRLFKLRNMQLYALGIFCEHVIIQETTIRKPCMFNTVYIKLSIKRKNSIIEQLNSITSNTSMLFYLDYRLRVHYVLFV